MRKRVAVLGSFVTFVALVSTGCAASTDPNDSLVVKDARSITDAVTSTGGDEAMYQLYATVRTELTSDDPIQSARVLEAELPPLLDTIAAEVPIARERVAGLKLRTETGEKLRKFTLDVQDKQLNLFALFASELKASPTVLLPLDHWTQANETLRRDTTRRMERFLQAAPEDAQQAIADAFSRRNR